MNSVNKQAGNKADGYQRLIAAIVCQAVKDGAVWFLESETGKAFCAAAGIKPENRQRSKHYDTRA